MIYNLGDKRIGDSNTPAHACPHFLEHSNEDISSCRICRINLLCYVMKPLLDERDIYVGTYGRRRMYGLHHWTTLVLVMVKAVAQRTNESIIFLSSSVASPPVAQHPYCGIYSKHLFETLSHRIAKRMGYGLVSDMWSTGGLCGGSHEFYAAGCVSVL